MFKKLLQQCNKLSNIHPILCLGSPINSKKLLQVIIPIIRTKIYPKTRTFLIKSLKRPLKLLSSLYHKVCGVPSSCIVQQQQAFTFYFFSNSTHTLNFFILTSDCLIYLTASLNFVINSFRSLKPCYTTRFIMWATHLICK